MVILPSASLALGEGSYEVRRLVRHVLKHYAPKEIIILVAYFNIFMLCILYNNYCILYYI